MSAVFTYLTNSRLFVGISRECLEHLAADYFYVIANKGADGAW